MTFRLRRMVTGNDANGRSVVSMDTRIDSRPGRFGGNNCVQEFWQTDSMPPKLDGPDAVAERTGTSPKPRGTIVRLLQNFPGSSGELHRTQTIDYFVVLEGEIEMTLDDGKFVALKKGDTVVMRNTSHGWRNTSDKPCLLFEVLVDAKGAPGLLPPNV